MTWIYVAIAATAGVAIPLAGAAVATGRLLERLDAIKELFAQAIAHWEKLESMQDAQIEDHEQRIRALESHE